MRYSNFMKFLIMFFWAGGGGKSEVSVEPPDDALTIGGVTITIDGDTLEISGG